MFPGLKKFLKNVFSFGREVDQVKKTKVQTREKLDELQELTFDGEKMWFLKASAKDGRGDEVNLDCSCRVVNNGGTK